MGKGFYISKPVAIVAVIVGAGAVATIIALSVVYSQEKAKNNNNVLPTDGGITSTTTSTPPVTTTSPPSVTTTSTPSVPTSAPADEPWDKYRLPKSLVPDHYNVTLWPRLTNVTATLYIFTGKALIHRDRPFFSFCQS